MSSRINRKETILKHNIVIMNKSKNKQKIIKAAKKKEKKERKEKGIIEE